MLYGPTQHPSCELQAAVSLSKELHHVAVPRHLFRPATSVQPEIRLHVQLAESPAQSAHATEGVPSHRGWFAAVMLAAMIVASPGTPITADLQQSCPGHWLLSVQSWGQAALQTPPQQPSPAAVSHSASLVQTAGQVIRLFTQSPLTDMPAVAPARDAQHDSPAAALHSASVVHEVMQVPLGTQVGTVKLEQHS